MGFFDQRIRRPRYGYASHATEERAQIVEREL
jgi:hypothetical protein